MDFNRQWKDNPPELEVVDSKSLVETAGYIPADRQIRDMIDAGIRLGEYRKEKYDMANESEDDEVSMPISARMDMAEISTMAMTVSQRIQRIKANQEKKRKIEEGKTAKEEENKGVV